MEKNNYKFSEFSDRETLVEEFSSKIIHNLTEAIEVKGYANLAVSGGSTPKKLFQHLSQIEIPWSKVRVTLVDERWVDKESNDSNEKLVRDNLLQNYAAKASFISLKTQEKYAKDSLVKLESEFKKLSLELDVVVLGMGLDAHTASFFPHTRELEEVLSSKNLVCATAASAEPKERITLSRNYLLLTKYLYLHIEGIKKKEVFEKAIHSNDIYSMPIVSMMQQKKPLLEVYYAD